MSDTIPTPVDLLRLAYGASDELDVWLDEHLPPAEAATPSEHPRWPDGTPVYIGQRVGWSVMRGVGAWSSKVERLPDEYDQVVIRSVGGFRYEVPFHALVRLDPEGDHR